MLVVHLATDMAQTVADYQVVYPQQEVVVAYLVEHTLSERDIRCFVFHNHLRRESLCVEHTVTTQFFSSQLQLHLICQQGGGVAKMVGQIMHEMLSYPFFGSDGNESPAQVV